MNTFSAVPMILTLAMAASLTACARAPQPASRVDAAVAGSASPATSGVASAPSTAASAASAAPASTLALPLVVMHKSATCGCCTLWADHMREAGFKVETRVEDNLNTIKERVGVPLGKGSCHTAEVGGYFVEGHVPADDVKRLLAEKPDAKGLTVPGMPAGSPGMELPDGTTQPYTVELVGNDGSVSAFAEHGR